MVPMANQQLLNIVHPRIDRKDRSDWYPRQPTTPASWSYSQYIESVFLPKNHRLNIPRPTQPSSSILILSILPDPTASIK
jgi:hypothetical protein